MQTIQHQYPQGYNLNYQQLSKPNKKQYQTVSDHQVDIEFQDQLFQSQQQFAPSFGLKTFFSYLYFTQGLTISLCSTMPYIYPELPSYNVMAVFGAALLPFSFKFLLAPVIEKYTYFDYGKRKFWIILSQFFTAICLLFASFFTSFQDSYNMAIILFFTIVFVTLQDISLDSLANKELRHAHITSSVSVTSQLTGSIIGSMLLLKLTSVQFAKYFGLQTSIASISTIIICLSAIIFIPSAIIHFTFKQTKLKRQYESLNKPLAEIFCSYKIFFKPHSKYCRTILFLLIINQGFNFFLAGYDYELVKAGFSRDTNNTIQNIVAIPINVIACFMTAKIQWFGIKKGIIVSSIGQLLIFSYLRVFFPTSVYQIAIASMITGIMMMWLYMITVILIYQFPIHRYSGMFITFLASFCNLGSNTALHTKILDRFGWWTMSWVGLIIQVFIVFLVYWKLYEWMEAGDIDLEKGLDDEKDGGISENQNQLKQKNISTLDKQKY